MPLWLIIAGIGAYAVYKTAHKTATTEPIPGRSAGTPIAGSSVPGSSAPATTASGALTAEDQALYDSMMSAGK